jgi:two-component system, NarL family, sensor histidine kinase DesK
MTSGTMAEPATEPGARLQGMDRLVWGDIRIGLVVRLAPLLLILPASITFVLKHATPARLAIILPTLAVYVVVVLWALVVPRQPSSRRVVAGIVLLTVLAIVILRADTRPEWYVLFYYPAAGAALLGSLRQTAAALAPVSIVALVSAWLVGGGPGDGFELGLECAFVGVGVVAVSRLIRAYRDLDAARAEVARLAAADERLRIARDVHDLLGHGLSVIALKAELAGRLLPANTARAAAEVSDILSVSRRALEDVRGAVAGYRRVTLLRELDGARTALEAAGIEVEIAHDAGDLADAVDEAFGWSVREGVTNIIRHGNASRSSVRTSRAEGLATLEITNDGPIVPTESTAPIPWGGGNAGTGLAGLAERTAATGGWLEAGPRLDGGYRLLVVLPLGGRTQ